MERRRPGAAAAGEGAALADRVNAVDVGGDVADAQPPLAEEDFDVRVGKGRRQRLSVHVAAELVGPRDGGGEDVRHIEGEDKGVEGKDGKRLAAVKSRIPVSLIPHIQPQPEVLVALGKSAGFRMPEKPVAERISLVHRNGIAELRLDANDSCEKAKA